MNSPLVSVVIPSTGRPSLRAAVDSVLAQTYPHLEAIVVYDGEGDLPVEMPADPRVKAVSTRRRSGVAVARTVGIEMSEGKYLALLDDDDTWTRVKLEVQVPMLEEHATAGNIICASRIRLVDGEGNGELLVPRRLIRQDEPVGKYLFERRHVRWGEAVIHPSTIVCERKLAARTPWPAISIHEDWDWLLRLAAENDANVIMAEAALVNVTETAGSASRSTKWRESLAWVSASRLLTGRQRADILLCTTAAYARAAGNRRATSHIARRAFGDGPPGVPACLFFLAFQLLPPNLLTRLARVVPTPSKFRSSWAG